MACDCPTCQCDHAGKFPRFAFYYTDGSIYRGGGPEDKDQVVFSLPRSWFDMPSMGVGVGLVEDSETGRFVLSGREQYYALAPQTRGGPDVTFTGVESRLIPVVTAQYGIVKLGEHMQSRRYYDLLNSTKDDEHVPVSSGRPCRALQVPEHKD